MQSVQMKPNSFNRKLEARERRNFNCPQLKCFAHHCPLQYKVGLIINVVSFTICIGNIVEIAIQ